MNPMVAPIDANRLSTVVTDVVVLTDNTTDGGPSYSS